MLGLKIDVLGAGWGAELRADGHRWKELQTDSHLGQSVPDGQQVFCSHHSPNLDRGRNMELALHRIVVLHGTLGFLCWCCDLHCGKLNCALLKLHSF